VLLKISRTFDRVYEMLTQLKLDTSAVFVRRVRSADEEVVSDLASLVGKKLDYLSLLIVKK
jgi:precorrin-2/cobalt-factor-2 C20-methyltransferase